jgi:hypothetical protein
MPRGITNSLMLAATLFGGSIHAQTAPPSETARTAPPAAHSQDRGDWITRGGQERFPGERRGLDQGRPAGRAYGGPKKTS